MSSYSKGFFLGLFSGATVGSLFALLYAPDKGSTTRDRLSYRLNNYLNELNELVDELRTERNDIVSDAKLKGDQVVEDAQKKAEDLISEAEQLLKSLQETKKEVSGKIEKEPAPSAAKNGKKDRKK